MLAHDVVEHALEAGGVDALAPPPVAIPDLDLVVLAAQDRLLGAPRQSPPRGADVEGQLLAQGLELTGEVLLVTGPRRDGPLRQGELLVGDDELGIDLQPGADARARRAGAVGGVEGEGARLDFLQGEGMVVGAGPPLGVTALPGRVVGLQVDPLDGHEAVGQAQSGLHRVVEARADAVADHQAVDHDVDVVAQLLLQARRVVEADDVAVHPRPGEALGGELGEQLGVLALPAADHGGQHLEPGPLLQGEHPVDYLLGGLRLDPLVAHGAVLEPARANRRRR